MADDVANGNEYRTTFDTNQGQPNVDITNTVAELKGVESDELAPLYDSINSLLDNIFSRPPQPEAEVEVSFSYEGFRITVRQDGTVSLESLE